MPTLLRHLREDLVLGNGHLLDQVLRKKWHPSENSPHGAWDHIAEEMLLEFAESGHPIFRATIPLSRGQLKSKGRGKVVYTLHCRSRYSWYISSHYSFLSISSVSTEQWQPHARNLKTIKIERCNLWYWWDNQLFLVKSKQKTPVHDEDPQEWPNYLAAIHSTSWITFTRKQTK